MTNLPDITPSQEAGDLSTCEREPIHIPGSIQPHGVLLSLDEASNMVLQASQNACEVFRCEMSEVLGRTLSDLLGSAQAARLVPGLRSDSSERNPLYVGSVQIPNGTGQGQTYNAIGHRLEGTLILELEKAEQAETADSRNLYPLVRTFMAQLQEAKTVSELSQMAAEEVRRITGFDRVLIYRFDPEWHGHVIAESRNQKLPSYDDLWFPASDIPAQARELYKVNRIRLIADAAYTPVPIAPVCDPRTSKPLDLSYSTLRSVSPVHIEYLKNMGVSASMSISVIREGRLWGLIALHHSSPRHVPFEVRIACDFLGQALSSQIVSNESRAEYEHRLYLKSISTRLLGFMAEEEHFIEGLIHHPDELLAFGDAGGAAVLFEGRCALVGQTPNKEEVWRIVDWLTSEGQQEVFQTDCLQSVMPGGDTLQAAASGLLAISISKLYRSYVLWFRPEVQKTVKWGGDPRKPVETNVDGTMRIHPRKSFETWKETVSGRSLAWRQSEVESASELRIAVIGIVLRKAEELAALSAELKRSNTELEAFSYSVSHDLRAPFRHIIGYAELLQDHLGEGIDGTSKRFIDTITNAAESAGNLVDNLLNFSRVGRAKLHLITINMRKLVDEVRDELLDYDAGHPIVWDIAPLPAIQGDPVLLRLVWQNLLSNALKFSSQRPESHIKVGCKEDESEVVFSVQDNGVGFKQVYVNKLFGVFQRLHAQNEFAGTGIGLANVRRAIGKHGGRTWAEGELGVGATFYFSLPRRIHVERESVA